MQRTPNKAQQRVFARRDTAQYKLVVFFKQGLGNNSNNRPRVFYSYKHHDMRQGMGNLVLSRLVTVKYKGLFITALLYDNLSGTLLKKWIGSIEEGGQSA